METQQLHRGRLIDHIQLVVADLEACRRFYTAVFDTLGIPVAGSGDDHFWADELFISTAGSDAAQGKLTLKHGPIANLEMPGMTMVFKVADPKLLQGLKEGDKVKFSAERVGGAITVTAIERAQ